MTASEPRSSRPSARICVVGAGPCGLATVKNLLAVGLTDIVCYEEHDAIGGNWAFSEDTGRVSVYDSTHLISSRRLSSFDDFPMPDDYPDFPSHAQMRAYFHNYAAHFGLAPFIALRSLVKSATKGKDGRWLIVIAGPDGERHEWFDHLIVCSGHHREPFVPEYRGHFSGQTLHSAAFKRPEPFAGKRVLVVGAGNSGCDIAVDVGRVAAHSSISIREGCYIGPKIAFGRPIDVLYAKMRRKLPRFLTPLLMRVFMRIVIGPWEKYGLATPQYSPLQMHPTLNTNFLSALRDGVTRPRVGIARLDGDRVHFVDGTADTFDVIIWATGFRNRFAFLDHTLVDWDWTERPPLYLKMMHGSDETLFFVGLFQPLGCIWPLADLQARIAALQIVGKLRRPADLPARIEREQRVPHWAFKSTPRHTLEVDSHDFRAELMRELRSAEGAPARRSARGAPALAPERQLASPG